MRFPLLAQQLEGFIRQRNIPIFVSFAPMYVDESPGAVDIWNLEMSRFLKSQTAGVNRGETHLVSE
jgi:hypothetical protein